MVSGIEKFRDAFRDYSGDKHIDTSGLVKSNVMSFLASMDEEILPLEQIGVGLDKNEAIDILRKIYLF